MNKIKGSKKLKKKHEDEFSETYSVSSPELPRRVSF